MPVQKHKLETVEFNHQIGVEINTLPGGETPTYASMTNLFKNIDMAINEVLYSAAYLGDGGANSTLVVGNAPTVSMSGDFSPTDPACIYLQSIEFKTGRDRITDIKMTRGGKIITCPITLTQINISGGEATAANAINITMTFNGQPTVGNAQEAPAG